MKSFTDVSWQTLCGWGLCVCACAHTHVSVCVRWQTLRPVSVSLCQTRLLASCRPLISSLPILSNTFSLTRTHRHNHANSQTDKESW